ncbi:transporter [Klebsiella spallanzanii]|uniref:Phenol degradation protein meta n=1 Tax=Klebsiella spallanzanii TaxID=2587528 RepID=A0A564HD15_9ENTR|nr:transporter [Klebsiella spallanzanii]VUS30065.1 hypothetical protein SB6408_00261 [Klebsiella spallanzanii]
MIPCNPKVHVKSPLLAMTLGLTAFQSVAMEFPADRTRTAVFTPDSGFLPPADTTTLGLGYLYNDWHQLTDSHGDKLAPFKKIKAFSRGYMPALITMTDKQLLGADYGFGVALPIMHVRIDNSIATPIGEMSMKGEDKGPFALFLSPLILAWRDPTYTFTHNLQFNIDVPINHLDGDNPANVAQDYYATGVTWQFTWSPVPSYQIGSGLSYQYNFQNKHRQHPTTSGPEGKYHNGDILVWNVGVGKQFGNWSLGLTSYWLQQLRADRIDGADDFDGPRAREFGFGPVLKYQDLRSPHAPSLALHYSHGVSSRDAVTGDYVTLIATWTL